MFRPRVIPVLLLKDLGLVKTIGFKKPKYIGDPINAVKIFNDLKADELVFLDTLASKQGRTITLDFVRNVGEEANMPFAVGGGIKTLNDIQKILSAGAEKVILCSAALENPDFIRHASENFGSSTITVCIDYATDIWNRERVYSRGGSRSSSGKLVDIALRAQKMGAGEIILQSVRRDGRMSGYDIESIRKVSEAVTVPVVALGGASTKNDLVLAHTEGYATAVAAGSMFVYHDDNRGVLINYPGPEKLRHWFAKQERV